MVGPACSIYDLTEFDAVVVVGALYANRWHRDARRFVRRHTAALRSCRSGWSAVARWTTRPNTGTLHPQSKSPSWPTELAPADMSRSVAACRRMQRGFPPQRWPRPRRATGATRLTSGVGWNRSWPSSSRGRLRALKPVTRADYAERVSSNRCGAASYASRARRLRLRGQGCPRQ